LPIFEDGLTLNDFMIFATLDAVINSHVRSCYRVIIAKNRYIVVSAEIIGVCKEGEQKQAPSKRSEQFISIMPLPKPSSSEPAHTTAPTTHANTSTPAQAQHNLRSPETQ